MVAVLPRVWPVRLEYMHVFIFIVSEKVEVLSELLNPISITNQGNTGLSPQDGEPHELQ